MQQKSLSEIGLFIVGNFFNNRSGTPRTQAEELKKILEKKSIRVFAASRYLQRLPRLLDTIFSLIRYSFRYHVVNIQFYGGLALVLEDVASGLAKLMGKKVIFTLHGGAIPDKVKMYPRWYTRVLSRGLVVTCPSPYMIHHLSALGLNMKLIENSLPLHEYQHQPKDKFRPRLLWMRSFHPIYNPEMALQVVQLLKPKYPDIQLYMAGVDLGHLEQTKDMASRMNLQKEVIFPGYLDIQQKNHLAEECDVYICTNRIDNTPVSLLEMMALGLPVVSTNVGGIPFMVKAGREALLVKSEDAEAMADAIEQLLTNPELGKRLVKEAKKLLAPYDEKEVAQKWLKLLGQMN